MTFSRSFGFLKVNFRMNSLRSCHGINLKYFFMNLFKTNLMQISDSILLLFLAIKIYLRWFGDGGNFTHHPIKVNGFSLAKSSLQFYDFVDR